MSSAFADIAEFELFARECILKKPRDKKLLQKFISGDDCSEFALGAGWALQIQLNSNDLIYSIFMYFCNLLGESRAKDIFQQQISRSLDSGSLHDVETAWFNIVRSQDPLTESPSLAADSQGYVDLFFSHILEQPKLIPVRLEEKNYEVPDFCLNTEHVLRCHQKLHEIDEEWALLIKSCIPDEACLQTVLNAERECSWIYRAALKGVVEVIDPYTGELIGSRDGVVAYGRGIYLFRSHTKKSFFLITGNCWNAAAGLYLPSENAAIVFSKSASSLFSGKTFSNLLKAYLRSKAKNAIGNTLHSGIHDDNSTAVVVYVPPTDNFAHHLWNYNSCLYRLSGSLASANVRSIVYSGSEFFGPLSKMYTAFGEEQFLRPRRQNTLDPNDFTFKPLILPAGGYFIHPGLIKLCIDAASSIPKVSSSILEPADIENIDSKVIIWISLRTRGRAWTPQVESVSDVINGVSAIYPMSFFVLDGFSTPIGLDDISHKWTDALNQLTAIADSIISRCGSNVISLIGNTFRESLLWASASHLYVAPYGSSQHKVGWFTGAKGLVYVPNTIKETQALSSAGLCASPISSQPELVFCELAGTDSLSYGPKRSFAVSNYDVVLSPKYVISWLTQEIQKLVMDTSRNS